ncbi:cytochrome C oxidase subunit IV family protein [Phenylobacterium sp. LjRoot219]|uniref:cytochrome C oxidase subunit IV family protein n=1 Tax=Phenylobacterium sp. LjRoot219 TaxID=3342283 RepID=UPI003ED01BC1
MRLLSRARLPIAWFGLSAITLVSWWISVQRGQGFEPNAGVTLSVILISAIKVRVIFREFMDVRHAPALLRYLTDAWLGLLVAALVAAYFLGGRL